MSFLKSIFGPSKDEVWGAIAEEIGANYKDGGFWKRDLLTAKHKNWLIYLDVHTEGGGKNSTTYTRMRADFVVNKPVYFRMYEEIALFSALAKKMGFQDIEIGDKKFDKRYMIKGDNQYLIKKIFSSESIKQIMLSMHSITLETYHKKGFTIIKNRKSKQGNELRFKRLGIMKDRTELLSLYALFCLFLDQLVEVGCASE